MQLEFKVTFNKNNDDDMNMKYEFDKLIETVKFLVKNYENESTIEELKNTVQFNQTEDDELITYILSCDENIFEYANSDSLNSLSAFFSTR